MMSHEDFIAYNARYGRCPNSSRKGRPLNDREVLTSYKRYVRAEEAKARRAILADERKKARESADVDPHGPRSCRLYACLSREERLDASTSGLNFSWLDRAHVFGKRAHPWMRRDRDNVVWLNHWSHLWLDDQRHPLSGRPISREEADTWWRRIVGDETYEILVERAKRRPTEDA